MPDEVNPVPKVADHLANERTFLAWVRTAIAVMAFGFVVVKFSLFLRQVALWVAARPVYAEKHTASGWLGIAIVGGGVLILVLSYFHFKKTENQIESAQYKTSSGLILILLLALCLMSVFLILYLIQSVKI